MEHRPRTGADVALGLIGVLAVLAGVLDAGGAVSALLARRRVPRAELFAGIAALRSLHEPSLAWHGPVGPLWLYWGCEVVALLLAGLLALTAWRLFHAGPGGQQRSTRRGDGLATRAEVRRVAGEKALLARGATLRPNLGNPSPGDLGYQLGRSRGVACFASIEDSMLLLGPPRSGKGVNVVIPMILDAHGAVVTTSTRPDNLAVTLRARRATGPVAVFDPQGLARRATGPDAAEQKPGHDSDARGPDELPRLSWSLTRGCAHPQTAMCRAEALVPDGSRSGVENGSFWRTQALSVTRALLHSAALGEKTPADLYRWSHSATAAKEAVVILSAHCDATPGWERALDAVIAADQRTRDSVWAMVANTFAPLGDPDVLSAVSPARGEEFDPLAFLAMRGTLYLLGTASGASATATIVAALIEDIVEAARRLAARSPGQRLDPPLALLLDEAANYPLPSLPSLMSEGGGSGITTLAVLQSLAQARDRFGTEAAGAIWDSAIVKIVLGGSANADDLADISRLVGDEEVTEWSETIGGAGTTSSHSSQVRTRAILEPSAIRRLGIGTALLLLRSAPPVLLELSPWTARRDAAQLHAARAGFEELSRA